MDCVMFRRILDRFSECVKDGHYTKMDYKLWRQLIRYCDKDPSEKLICFEIKKVGEISTIEMYNVKGEYLFTLGFISDKSFGDFLIENNIVREKDFMTSFKNESIVNTSDLVNAINNCYTNITLDSYSSNNNYGWTTTGNITMDEFCKKSECPYTKEKTEKENEKMNFNFDFGQITNDTIRMSPYGIAIKNRDGKWVSFNAQTEDVIDVDCFNFNMKGMLWKMPVAVSTIKVGDVVIHNRKPMYVVSIENGIWAADIYEGEKKSIMPLTNMFGFNFITKIVSIMDMTGNFNVGADNTPTAENPFGGNFMSMMFMCQMFGEDSDMGDIFSGDMGKMMMMSMMMGGQNPFVAMFNPNK